MKGKIGIGKETTMKKARIALCMAILFFLGGCAQMTRGDKILASMAGCGAVGAGIGAGAGDGHRGRAAAIAGVTSALLCGLAAYYMTEEAKPAPPPPPPPPEPRPTPPPPPPPPAPKPVERTIILDNVLFDFDKTAVKPDGAKILDRLIVFLKENADKKVELEGHTDSVGTDQYNQSLSEKRAVSVKDYLTKRGVAASRIATKGFGESKPIADNKTAEGRAKNRRVEIKVR
jgi:outer membrane protein OmpA-like peptidoglycan-associated protein